MAELTPIYTALKKYQAENGLRLHMPGHAGEERDIRPGTAGDRRTGCHRSPGPG